MKKLRIYLDTSVLGGCLNEEFADARLALIEMAQRGEVILLISILLVDELLRAPEEVTSFFDSLSVEYLERVQVTPEAESLRDRYVESEVVGEGSADDALHVAMATVANADLIVSWNFRHIVHFEKIRGFNAVNLLEGYQQIEIRSP